MKKNNLIKNEGSNSYYKNYKSFEPIMTNLKSTDPNENYERNINNKKIPGGIGLLAKRKNDRILQITFPLICSNDYNCKNESQKNRFGIIMSSFIKFKSLIENDKIFGKNNQNDNITEFILDNHIDRQFITHIKN